jgi:UDP-N-acetylmuramate dehydrogenase
MPAMNGIEEEPSSEGMLFCVGAGVRWDDFVVHTMDRGYGDAVTLSGIPGSTGAVPVQNVGAYGAEVGEMIREVRVLDRIDLSEKVIPADQCDFSYRSSRFKTVDRDRYVILEVIFLLNKSETIKPAYSDIISRLGDSPVRCDPDSLHAYRNTVISIRKEKSMIYDPEDPDSISAGSFFTNPVVDTETFEFIKKAYAEFAKESGKMNSGNPLDVPGYRVDGGWKIPAAWLVEHSGFPRGSVYKGAGVSSKHSLALINRGGSTRDLLELASAIQKSVKSKFNVWLVREPVYASLSGPEFPA